MDAPSIQDELPEIIRRLRQPAGSSADLRFSNLEQIRGHRTEFLTQTHAAWKEIHGRAVDELMKIEGILASPNAGKFPSDFSWFLRYTMAIWRRVNDALAWSVLGLQDHQVRRMCHRKPRPTLLQANPEAMRRLLDRVNSDPLSFVLWSDATSCIDVGDVICRSFSGGLNGIFEVKEGKVNERIIDLLTSPGDIETKASQIDNFAQEYGEKGIEQLGRVIRQRERTEQVQKILDTDEGFDPYRGEYIKVQQADVRVETYDNCLADAITQSADHAILQCIDGCLWVYIDRDPGMNPKDRVEAFSAAVFQQSPGVRRWNEERYGVASLAEVASLNENLFVPEALPLFLRQLDPDAIRDVLLGGLKDRVLLYFDWVQYGHLIESLGAELIWSTAKAGRREKSRPYPKGRMTVGGRVPRLRLANGRFIEGQSKVYRVLFDGLLPSVIARQYVEILRSAEPGGHGGSK
jgi:hypothetical protein